MSDHFHVHESVRDYHKGIKPRSHFHSIELKINLHMFYGYNNVQEYLGCQMKVEKLFEFHQVEEFRRLSTATSSFQEYVMSWWKQRQYDVSIGRKFKILNWKELKACMRRKFVPSSYLEKREEEKKKKIERINKLEKHLAHLGHELKGIELIEEKFNRMIHKEKERKEEERKERRERKEQERQDKCLSRAEPDIDITNLSLILFYVPNFHDSSFFDSSLFEYFVHHFLSRTNPSTNVFKLSLECHSKIDDVYLVDSIVDRYSYTIHIDNH